MIISCAVKLVTIGLQNPPPSLIVADYKSLTGLTLSNQSTVVVGVVIDIGDVCDWEIDLLKVLQPGGIAANNDVLGNSMPTLGNPLCNPP